MSIDAQTLTPVLSPISQQGEAVRFVIPTQASQQPTLASAAAIGQSSSRY